MTPDLITLADERTLEALRKARRNARYGERAKAEKELKQGVAEMLRRDVA